MIIAGWNMPGYMPETDPMEFDNDTDAVEFLKDNLLLVVDGLADKYSEAELDAVEEQIKSLKMDDFPLIFEGYAYWLDGDV